MFYETRRGKVSYFSFSELEEIPGFVHAFTSRKTDSQLTDAADAGEVARCKSAFLDALGLRFDQVAMPKQIHSNRVVDCRTLKDSTPVSRERLPADGVLLDGDAVCAVVQTADCLPILALAPAVRRACLLHAGWRGTRDHIARVGVDRLLRESGARPAEVVVAFGPAIRACCYEVGEEVRGQFESAGHDVARIFESRRLDLIEANRSDLESLGVASPLDSGICTSCRPDLFYSWRKNRDSGRMWALAGFRV